jgi:hypothetical protein
MCHTEAMLFHGTRTAVALEGCRVLATSERSAGMSLIPGFALLLTLPLAAAGYASYRRDLATARLRSPADVLDAVNIMRLPLKRHHG